MPDDFSIYCNSEKEARNTGNSVYLFLGDKLKLPINREKAVSDDSGLFHTGICPGIILRVKRPNEPHGPDAETKRRVQGMD